MDRYEVEVHKNVKKGQCPAILTEQAWSIKDLLYGPNFTPNNSFNAPLNVSAQDFQNQPQ